MAFLGGGGGGKSEKTGGKRVFLRRFVHSNRLFLALLGGVQQHEVVGAVFQLAFGPLDAAAADCKMEKKNDRLLVSSHERSSFS